MRTFNSAWFVYLLLSRGLTFLPLTSAAFEAQEEIEVPNRPEGVANGFSATQLLIGQVDSGEILTVNVKTGFRSSVVKPSDNGERQAWGLEYAPRFGAILVAGGGPNFGGGKPEVYVYSKSGQLKATCEPSSTGAFGSFINDVTVIGDTAYITDSQNDSVMTLDVAAAMRGDCEVSSIALPSAVFEVTSATDFSTNGIAAYNDGILVTHEFDASVWYVNIEDPSEFQQVIADGLVPGADGLIIDGNTLYVTLNAVDKIAVFELSTNGGIITAEAKGCYGSTDLKAPSTSAIVKDYIYSANSQFFDFPGPEEPPENNVIGIPLDDDLGACT